MGGRRVFLDVGGHVGETLVEAVQPRWRFDRIWSFEPSSRCWPELDALEDDRVEVVRAGWWTADTDLDLFDPGTLGGSISDTRVRVGDVERCRFVDASAWLGEHVTDDDEVWAKVNIEGAEVDVLAHLLDTGAVRLIDHLVVRFDVEKQPDGRAPAEAMRQRLRAAGVRYVEGRHVMFGRDQAARTVCWLEWTERDSMRDLATFWRRRAEHQARRFVYRKRRRLATGRR